MRLRFFLVVALISIIFGGCSGKSEPSFSGTPEEIQDLVSNEYELDEVERAKTSLEMTSPCVLDPENPPRIESGATSDKLIFVNFINGVPEVGPIELDFDESHYIYYGEFTDGFGSFLESKFFGDLKLKSEGYFIGGDLSILQIYFTFDQPILDGKNGYDLVVFRKDQV